MALTEVQIAKKFINKAKNAEEKGQEFTLTLREFRRLMLLKRCHYTGVKLQDGNPLFVDGRTIDRIDSSKGYIKGNVVICSSYFNQLKGVFEDANSSITLKGLENGLKTLRGF